VLIDWFTVLAQIVNFLVLVALMKRFLYGPLIKAIDDREALIATQLAGAARKKTEAESEMRHVQQQIAEFEDRGAKIIAEASSEADKKKNEMIESARNSVRGLEQRWRDDLRLEQKTFFNEIRQEAAGEILAITRHVLADLANADIEHCAVEVFLEKLRSFDAGAIRKLSADGLTVVSAKQPPEELQRQIEKAIEKSAGEQLPIHFDQSPDMAWGIALQGGGQRIGWTPDGYLDSLEERLRETIGQQTELIL
jgi:F-type H+-transporting ATPase subunit b